MNKGLVAVLVFAVVAVGAGGYLMMRNQAPAPSTEIMMDDQTNTEGMVGASTSLRSLLALGTSQQCTFSDVEKGSSGTVYVSGGQMRGDFSSTVAGAISTTHIYTDGADAYIWFDGNNSGYKVSLSQMTPSGTGTEAQAQKNVDLDEPIDFQCQPWSPNAAVLSYPASVEFQAMGAITVPPAGAMMGDSEGTGANSAQCSACDSLDGAAATQCRQALGC